MIALLEFYTVVYFLPDVLHTQNIVVVSWNGGHYTSQNYIVQFIDDDMW